MPTTIKTIKPDQSAIVKDYRNDPYFVKKAEHAKETLKKITLPLNLKKSK